jgi:hypothetical protein
VAGVALSIVLQIVWFSGWVVFPLLVDVALLWAIFGQHVTVIGVNELPKPGVLLTMNLTAVTKEPV